MATREKVQELTLITTDHWLTSWFNLIIPTSRYAKADIEFVNIAKGTTLEKINAVCKAIKCRPDAATFACTDCAMEVYSAAVELLKAQGENMDGRGCSFHCFFIATNKLACRRLVDGCDDLKCRPVMVGDRKLPDLGTGVEAFFKPLAECGSKGVFKYSGSGADNPLYLEAGTNQGNVCALVGDPTLAKLAITIDELKPYLNPRIVGIAEEYVSPMKHQRKVVSIDGFVCRGKITHFCISDNVYKTDEPEIFDSLVTPTQRLTAREIAACWTKYDTVAADFIRRGLNNQFLDVEAFVLRVPSIGKSEVTVVVKTMEINCRTYCNQLPVFSRLFGGKGGNGCMLSASVDMLLGKIPPIDQSFSNTAVRAVDAAKQRQQKVGICIYMDLIPGCPALVQSEAKDVVYYGVEGFQAQVYAFAVGEAAARTRCALFCKELQAKHAAKSE